MSASLAPMVEEATCDLLGAVEQLLELTDQPGIVDTTDLDRLVAESAAALRAALDVEETAETLLTAYLCTVRGGLAAMPDGELDAALNATSRLIDALNSEIRRRSLEGHRGDIRYAAEQLIDAVREEPRRGPCGHDGCNHRSGHAGRHSWQEDPDRG